MDQAYLQTLLARTKWIKSSPNPQVGDVVIVKDEILAKPHWPLALILKIYSRADGLVRVVDVRCRGKTYRLPIHLFLVSSREGQLPDVQTLKLNLCHLLCVCNCHFSLVSCTVQVSPSPFLAHVRQTLNTWYFILLAPSVVSQ